MGKASRKSEAQKANRSEKNKKAKARDETAKAAKQVFIPEALTPVQHNPFQPAPWFRPQIKAAPLPTVMENSTGSDISCKPKIKNRASLVFRIDTVDFPVSDEPPVDLTSLENLSPNSNKVFTDRASKKSSPTSKSSSTKFTLKNKTLKAPSENRTGFDQYLNDLKCRRLGCDRMTNAFDGSTVICPKCSPKSLVRYCSLKCLLDPDIRRHFHEECGGKPVPTNCIVNSVILGSYSVNMRPFVHCAFATTERHRQAVYHSANVMGGDYFIFDDLWVADSTGRDGSGKGQVIADFPNPFAPKKRFQTALENCLREGYLCHELVMGLVWMIVAWLKDVGQWSRTRNIAKELAHQIFREFSCKIPKETLDGFLGTVEFAEAFYET